MVNFLHYLPFFLLTNYTAFSISWSVIFELNDLHTLLCFKVLSNPTNVVPK